MASARYSAEFRNQRTSFGRRRAEDATGASGADVTGDVDGAEGAETLGVGLAAGRVTAGVRDREQAARRAATKTRWRDDDMACASGMNGVPCTKLAARAVLVTGHGIVSRAGRSPAFADGQRSAQPTAGTLVRAVFHWAAGAGTCTACPEVAHTPNPDVFKESS